MADPDIAHTDIAGWVLGAPDPDESERFQAHLEICDECQREVAELSPSATLLEAAAPGVDLATGPDFPADLQARTVGRCGPGGAGTAPWPAGRCYPAACFITEATACGWDT